MADDANDGGAQGGADDGLGDRVGRLEAGQESLTGKVDQILGILGGQDKPGDGEGGHPAQDSGGGIAREISAQLEEQRRKDAAAAAERDRDSRLATVETSLAEMTEKKPGPLLRRSTRVMWGKE